MNTEMLEVKAERKKRNTQLNYKIVEVLNTDPDAPTFDEILKSEEVKKILARFILK